MPNTPMNEKPSSKKSSPLASLAEITRQCQSEYEKSKDSSVKAALDLLEEAKPTYVKNTAMKFLFRVADYHLSPHASVINNRTDYERVEDYFPPLLKNFMRRPYTLANEYMSYKSIDLTRQTRTKNNQARPRPLSWYELYQIEMNRQGNRFESLCVSNDIPLNKVTNEMAMAWNALFYAKGSRGERITQVIERIENDIDFGQQDTSMFDGLRKSLVYFNKLLPYPTLNQGDIIPILPWI